MREEEEEGAPLTEVQEGLPLVTLAGQLVSTHQLFELPLGDVSQDLLQGATQHLRVRGVWRWVWTDRQTGVYLHVQVQPVVEVSAPEEVSEAQADVEGTQLLVPQRQETQDVLVVLVPPAGLENHRTIHQTNRQKQCEGVPLPETGSL